MTGPFSIASLSRGQHRLQQTIKPDSAVKFERLHGAQHPATQADHKKTVINLSSIRPEDAAYSALSKGLNYAVSRAALPIEDFITGVEKAIVSLPVEAAVFFTHP
jgi:hypothetical protein